MTELEFLKSKGLIKEGFTEFVISGEFGKVELTELLKEYKTEQLRLHVVSQLSELLSEEYENKIEKSVKELKEAIEKQGIKLP